MQATGHTTNAPKIPITAFAVGAYNVRKRKPALANLAKAKSALAKTRNQLWQKSAVGIFVKAGAAISSLILTICGGGSWIAISRTIVCAAMLGLASRAVRSQSANQTTRS